MKHGKALVLKTYEDGLLVLTAGGEFRRLKQRPPLPLPGEEIDVTPARHARWLPLALAAAVFLAAVLPLGALALRPAAYIALDINPSIGLTIARSGTVKSGEALNADGARLLREVPVVGKAPAAAVEGLVRQAALDGYLADRPEDVVLLTRVDFQSGSAVPLPDLEAAARQALEETGREAFVAVEEAAPSELMEARSSNISLNKLRLVKKLTPAPAAGRERQEIIAQSRDAGIKDILERAGKRADEVYRQGRREGVKKEHAAPAQQANGGGDAGRQSPPGPKKGAPPDRPQAPTKPAKKAGELERPVQLEPAPERSAPPEPEKERSTRPEQEKERPAQPEKEKEKENENEKEHPAQEQTLLPEEPGTLPAGREKGPPSAGGGAEKETEDSPGNKEAPEKAPTGAGKEKKAPPGTSGSSGGKKSSSTPRGRDNDGQDG